MHPRLLAAREQTALSRLSESCASLARKFGAAGADFNLAEITHRDPEIARLFRFERIADFVAELDGKLVEVQPTNYAAELLTLARDLGLSKAALDKIEAAVTAKDAAPSPQDGAQEA